MLALITLQSDCDGYQSLSVSLSISSTFFGLLKHSERFVFVNPKIVLDNKYVKFEKYKCLRSHMF